MSPTGTEFIREIWETGYMLKLNDNPPLIRPDKRIRDFNGTWWVAYCKSRSEKALAWDMVHKKISYFLPMSLNVLKKEGQNG